MAEFHAAAAPARRGAAGLRLRVAESGAITPGQANWLRTVLCAVLDHVGRPAMPVDLELRCAGAHDDLSLRISGGDGGETDPLETGMSMARLQVSLLATDTGCTHERGARNIPALLLRPRASHSAASVLAAPREAARPPGGAVLEPAMSRAEAPAAGSDALGDAALRALILSAQSGDRADFATLLRAAAADALAACRGRALDEASRDLCVTLVLRRLAAALRTYRPEACARRWYDDILRCSVAETMPRSRRVGPDGRAAPALRLLAGGRSIRSV